MDLLLETMEKIIPTPKRDVAKSPFMHVVRSFDVNKPGTPVEDIVGGIVGGSVSQGIFKLGDTIELAPGNKIEKQGKAAYEPLRTKIVSLYAGGRSVNEVTCGGLVAIGTNLDPSLTKGDGLVGNIAGAPGSLPPVHDQIILEPHLFIEAVGTSGLTKVEKIRIGESLVLNVGTAVTVANIVEAKGDHVRANLKRPICAESGSRIALSRRIADRWRLIGYGLTR